MNPDDVDSLLDSARRLTPELQTLEDRATKVSNGAFESAAWRAMEKSQRVFSLSLDLRSALRDLEIVLLELCARPPKS